MCHFFSAKTGHFLWHNAEAMEILMKCFWTGTWGKAFFVMPHIAQLPSVNDTSTASPVMSWISGCKPNSTLFLLVHSWRLLIHQQKTPFWMIHCTSFNLESYNGTPKPWNLKNSGPKDMGSNSLKMKVEGRHGIYYANVNPSLMAKIHGWVDLPLFWIYQSFCKDVRF